MIFKTTLSATVAAIAIAGAAIGSALLSLLGFYLFMRRRKAKQRAQAHDEEREIGVALDRAIVNYIVKELPNPIQDSLPEQRPSRPGYAMSTEMEAGPMSGLEGKESPVSPRSQPPTSIPAKDPSEAVRRPESCLRNTARSLHRRTASSCFIDSAEQVYGDILARPLEHDATATPSRPDGFTAAARRDDTGWPLTKQDWL